MGYFDFVVLAESNTTRIAFSTRGKEAFPYIDDVQVTALTNDCIAWPQSRTAEEGTTAILRLKTVSSTQGSTFQWFFRGTNLMPNATNTFLKLANLQPAQAGLYSVVVSNPTQVVTSAPAALSVIPWVEKRTVAVLWAAVLLNGTVLHFECADRPAGPWVPLQSLVQSNGRSYFVDRLSGLPDERFYRVGANSDYPPWLWIDSTTAVWLSGSVGTKLQIDCLNAIGPPDAWLPLDTVTLTSPTQLYSSDALLGKIGKLYRVLRLP